MEKTITTTCTRDCPGSCGLVGHVRDGRLVRLTGDRDHPITRGVVCKKVPTFVDRLYHPQRVVTPLVRDRNGDWQRASWDAALDVVAERLGRFCAEDGSLSVLHYQRWGSLAALKLLNRRFFNLLGGATVNSGTLCCGAGVAAQVADFGTPSLHSVDDLRHSRFIILWGRNPYTSTPQLVRALADARLRGVPIATVDPLHTRAAQLADFAIHPRPGSDAYLALAMARVLWQRGLVDEAFLAAHTSGWDRLRALIEEHELEDLAARCDVPVPIIEDLAERYGRARPAVIWLGGGPQRWVHGMDNFRMVQALGALTGNLGVPGGGISYMIDPHSFSDGGVLGADLAPQSRAVPAVLLGRDLPQVQDPPIRMAFIIGANPATQVANSRQVSETLDGLEFVVVVDQFLTDTADHADVFLPATTMLEEEDVMVPYGHHWVGPVNPVVEPQGEARSDLLILQDLASRLGFGEAMAGTPRQWLSRVLHPILDKGVDLGALMESAQRLPEVADVPFADGVFPTADGRFHLADRLPPLPTGNGDYPLHLLAVHGPDWLNSQLLPDAPEGLETARIHPETASALAFGAGDAARLVSAAGELPVRLALDEKLRPDVIHIAAGRWHKLGGGVNRLTSAVMTAEGESGTYYETFVRLERGPAL